MTVSENTVILVQCTTREATADHNTIQIGSQSDE